MSPGRLRVLYFHGFGSSPSSRKATALRDALDPDEFEFTAPDLNRPAFERLDWDAVRAAARAAAQAEPNAVIVGSSLGGLVALETSREVPAPLVLLAPVLGYGPLWTPPIPDGDPVRFFDESMQMERSFRRGFVDQLWAHAPDTAPPPAPVTVVMGGRDASVNPDRVRATFDRWRASGALAAASEFYELPDADHSLTGYDDLVAELVRRRARGLTGRLGADR